MFAVVDFSPMFLAVLLAWIVCVTLHEFSHALTAHFGGDESMRERGYLTLDPTRFIDPVSSLLIPAIVLLLGGFPLPGASVPVDLTRMRTRGWVKAVYAAGPASNLILAILFALVLHPKLGWVTGDQYSQPNWVYFIGAMAYLNMLAFFFNLIPLPPFDGFGLVEDQLEFRTREVLRQNAMPILFVVFALFWITPYPAIGLHYAISAAFGSLGFDTNFLFIGFYVSLYGVIPG